MTVTIRGTTVTEEEGYLMSGFWSQGDEIPEHIRILKTMIGCHFISDLILLTDDWLNLRGWKYVLKKKLVRLNSYICVSTLLLGRGRGEDSFSKGEFSILGSIYEKLEGLFRGLKLWSYRFWVWPFNGRDVLHYWGPFHGDQSSFKWVEDEFLNINLHVALSIPFINYTIIMINVTESHWNWRYITSLP